MLFGKLLFLSIECSILYLSLLKTYLSNELDRLTPLCKISWDNLSSQHRDIASSFWALSWNNKYIYVETGLCDQLHVCWNGLMGTCKNEQNWIKQSEGKNM